MRVFLGASAARPHDLGGDGLGRFEIGEVPVARQGRAARPRVRCGDLLNDLDANEVVLPVEQQRRHREIAGRGEQVVLGRPRGLGEQPQPDRARAEDALRTGGRASAPGAPRGRPDAAPSRGSGAGRTPARLRRRLARKRRKRRSPPGRPRRRANGDGPAARGRPASPRRTRERCPTGFGATPVPGGGGPIRAPAHRPTMGRARPSSRARSGSGRARGRRVRSRGSRPPAERRPPIDRGRCRAGRSRRDGSAREPIELRQQIPVIELLPAVEHDHRGPSPISRQNTRPSPAVTDVVLEFTSAHRTPGV
jgi:hypothetical protein